ncbi:MAG: metallophosphoesterase [Anaerolineales bacterium]
MTQALLIYNTLIFVLDLMLLVYLHRIKKERPVERTILLGIVLSCIIFLGAFFFPVDGFGLIQLFAWGTFLHLPLFFTAGGILLFRETKWFAYGLLILALLILGVAGDAFLIEPQKLEVTHTTLYSSKLDQAVTVALLADIQTDNPGSYEEQVLALTAAENPDLVLLAGDYLQIYDLENYQSAVLKFQNIFEKAQLDPPLGIFAVRGDAERDDWTAIFQDLGVDTFESMDSLDLGTLTLTGVSLHDSENPEMFIQGSEKYHIVFGHNPNYSLGEIDADLLLAGHTHGGQFQLPGIGPLLTISLVPRDWASGLTEISPGQYLLVSRGIGMERGYAPRMRFLCRPELVILEIKPVK